MRTSFQVVDVHGAEPGSRLAEGHERSSLGLEPGEHHATLDDPKGGPTQTRLPK